MELHGKTRRLIEMRSVHGRGRGALDSKGPGQRADWLTYAAHVPRHFSKRAYHEDQHATPVVLLKRGEHESVGARWVTVKLVDSLRTLEVGPHADKTSNFVDLFHAPPSVGGCWI